MTSASSMRVLVALIARMRTNGRRTLTSVSGVKDSRVGPISGPTASDLDRKIEDAAWGGPGLAPPTRTLFLSRREGLHISRPAVMVLGNGHMPAGLLLGNEARPEKCDHIAHLGSFFVP